MRSGVVAASGCAGDDAGSRDEVLAALVASPRADQQIAGLDRIHARALKSFQPELAGQGAGMGPVSVLGITGH
jgi:hypothetical protein